MLTALEQHCGSCGARLHLEHFRATDEVLRGSGLNAPFECELRRSNRTIHVGADQTIIQAMEDVGFFTRSDCREGTCGSCETDVIEGQVEHRDALLSDEERAESKTMMICVSRATSNRLVLDL
jgi:ferredoxin